MLIVRCLYVLYGGGYEKSLGVCVDGERGTNILLQLMLGSQNRSLRGSQSLKVSADWTASTDKPRQVSGQTD